MKKTLFLLPAVLCLHLLSSAQKFNVKWSEAFKVTSGMFTNNLYLKSVPAPDESIISLFSKVRTSTLNNDYILTKFNAKLDVAGQLELDYPKGSKEGFIDFVKLRNDYYLIEYRFTAKESADIILTKLDLQTFKKEATEKRLATVDASSNKPRMVGIGIGTMYNFKVDVSYSADSSAVLMVYEPDQSNKEQKRVQIITLTSDLKVSSVPYQWAEEYNKVDLFNSMIDNSGKVYLCYNVYEKNFNKEFKKSEGEKLPAYTSGMLVINNGAKSFYTFNGNNKFLHSISIAYNSNGAPMLIGMYKDKYNGRISGVFSTPAIGTTNRISNLAFTPFPADLLGQFDADKQGKNSGDKAGLDNEYTAAYVISVSDGVNHMISEYAASNFPGGMEVSSITRGNFLVTTFSADGKVQFQRLPRYMKAQTPLSANMYYSYRSFTPDYVGNNLYLFYNDDEENLTQDINKKPSDFKNEKKSVLAAAILGHDGKLVSRKVVYSHLDMDNYVTNLRFSPIKENTWVVFAVKAGNFKHQTMVGLLTVKP